jgi:nucleoid DNA-binding protein
MKYKSDLDREVAFILQVPHKRVRAITDTFIQVLTRAIAEDGEVDIPNFGVFRIRTVISDGGLDVRRPMEKKYVRFSKSRKLKRAVKEAQMEKYGVDETTLLPDFLEKDAGEESTCPDCGTRTERHGRILKCPRCGTAPYESVGK